MPTTSPDIGLVLDARYRIDALIARGGMATVYRGFDERLQRPVALKIMHPHLAENPEFISRFGREARSAARLTHPHVVSLYDQGEDQGRVYLAMQLVEGDTLRDELRREGPLTLKRALRVGRDVLSALDAAHRSGIIHRDIKPENVLVNTEHDILVADFGLARAMGSATTSATGTMLGTVAYVSPEVVTRGTSDARSDLYSWGIMMFEMLTGRTPFQGDSAVHIAYRHAHEDIPAPSQFFPELPSSIDALVTWASARLPASRPARAHEVLLALDEALDTLTTTQLNSRAPRDTRSYVDQDTAGILAATRGLEGLTPSPAPPTAPDEDSRAKGAGLFPAFLSAAAAAPEDAPSARTFHPHIADEADAKASSDSVPVEEAEASARDGGGTTPGENTDTTPSDESIREVALAARRRRVGWRTPSPRRSPLLGLVALAVLVLGFGSLGAAGAQWYNDVGPGADRTVPLLAGASLADAESALKADGLSLSTRDSFSDSVPKGHIIEASPSPGSVIKRGDPVIVVVSLGEYLIPVPDVKGKNADEARTQLTDLGFAVTQTSENSDTVAKGTVIRSEASAAQLAEGSPITLVVSEGPEQIEIPNVIGQGRAQAVKNLEAAGFTVKATQAHASRTPAGAISAQNPNSGMGVRGQTISIVESLGPDLVKVPDVFQKPEAEAKAALEKAGFTVKVTYEKGTPVLGLVYAQSVAAGEQAERGSTITIQVF